LGQYAVVEHFIAAATLFVQAVGQASAAQLARLFAMREFGAFAAMISKLLMVFVGTGILGTAIAMFLGPHLVTAIYGPGFEDAGNAFVWLMGAATVTFAASVVGYAATATGQYRGLSWRYGVTAAITTSAALALTPMWGLVGLALAVALGGFSAVALPLASVAAALRAAQSSRP
jgi:O-antigen/teichoic acid export membrane protein